DRAAAATVGLSGTPGNNERPMRIQNANGSVSEARRYIRDSEAWLWKLVVAEGIGKARALSGAGGGATAVSSVANGGPPASRMWSAEARLTRRPSAKISASTIWKRFPA